MDSLYNSFLLISVALGHFPTPVSDVITTLGLHPLGMLRNGVVRNRYYYYYYPPMASRLLTMRDAWVDNRRTIALLRGSEA